MAYYYYYYFYRNLYIFLSIVVWFHRNANDEDLFHNFFFRFVNCSSFMIEFSLRLKKVEVRGNLGYNVLEHRSQFHEKREVLL